MISSFRSIRSTLALTAASLCSIVRSSTLLSLLCGATTRPKHMFARRSDGYTRGIRRGAPRSVVVMVLVAAAACSAEPEPEPAATTTSTAVVPATTPALDQTSARYLTAVRNRALELRGISDDQLLGVAEVSCRAMRAGVVPRTQAGLLALELDDVMAAGDAARVSKEVVDFAREMFCPEVPASPVTTSPPVPVATTAAQPSQLIASYSGASDKNTGSFGVRSPWILRWTIRDGAGAAFEVKTEAGVQVAYSSADPGTDETVIRELCSGCYVEISTFGSTYEIQVIGVPL